MDGLCKKKPESSIKEWLQIPEDDYTISEQQEIVKDGKKRVNIVLFYMIIKIYMEISLFYVYILNFNYKPT